MILATFPLRLVRACIKQPLTRIKWHGNQFYTRQVIYGRLAPAFKPQARIHSTPL